MILEHADDPFGDDGGPAAGDVLIDDLEEGVLRRLQRLVDADLLRRRRHQVAGVGVVDLVGRRLQLERRVDWNTGTAGRRQRRRGRRRRLGRRRRRPRHHRLLVLALGVLGSRLEHLFPPRFAIHQLSVTPRKRFQTRPNSIPIKALNTTTNQ